MDSNELRLHRKQTKAFIDANPIALALVPRTSVNTGTGQKWTDGIQREVQTLRLIDQTPTFGPEPGTVLASDGRQRKAEYQLLGEHDAVVGKYDYWIDSAGIRFEVSNLIHRNGYEVRAAVIRYGEG